ncbi:hypothetical protein QF024_002744 [Chryseobacterium nepalense]|nr:hypothetical protein [Chryseobacterium nepalense]
MENEDYHISYFLSGTGNNIRETEIDYQKVGIPV